METTDKKKQTYKEKNGTTRVGDFLRSVKTVAPEILDLVGAISGYEGLSKLGEVLKGDITQNKTGLTDAQLVLALRELDLDVVETQQVTKRWEADMHSDSWLSKNIRPIILSFLILSSIIILVLDSSMDNFSVKEYWVDLLGSLTISALGGYFVLRQIGKYTDKKYQN